MTTVRLNDDINDKLSVLIELIHESKSEIIKKAIVEYYENHIQKMTPYEVGENLFGKYGKDENLAANHKARLKEKLHEKHAH
ncbi:MAG: CopG family transcriptional regulator [Spirochaetia bacterium]|nr:CopG family transcriptional regulator [Spirochaetia bacterium]